MNGFQTTASGRPAKVLVYGHINLNVIDGSAFFLSALTDMLSTDPLVQVDLALAVPLKRTLVLEDCLGRDNVGILDPFQDSGGEGDAGPSFPPGRLSHEDAAAYLAFHLEAGGHDLAIVRSTEVATFLADRAPHLMGRVIAYVTGVVSPSKPVSELTVDGLRRVLNTGGRIACQTEEMAEFLAVGVLGGDISQDDVVVMTPVVRAPFDDGREVIESKPSYPRFVYTGKFFKDWIPERIIAGFKRVRMTHREVTLDVAGDQFRADPQNPQFIPITKHLLETTEGLNWHGGVTREASRDLISSSDVGISWRSGDLSDSLELSTKLLEFGVLGKPCIMNRTAMHERLFGVDYPLFADSSEEFVRALRLCVDDPVAVRRAARTAQQVSSHYSMHRALLRLVRLLPAPSVPLQPSRGGDIVRLQLDEPDGGYDNVAAAIGDRAVVAHRFTGPTLELEVVSEGVSGGAADQSPALVRALVERRARMQYLRVPRHEETGPQLDLPRGTTPAAPRAEAPMPGTAETALRQQVQELTRTNAEVTAQNATLKQTLEARERSYLSLSRSKLGKLQLRYWKLRKGN